MSVSVALTCMHCKWNKLGLSWTHQFRPDWLRVHIYFNCLVQRPASAPSNSKHGALPDHLPPGVRPAHALAGSRVGWPRAAPKRLVGLCSSLCDHHERLLATPAASQPAAASPAELQRAELAVRLTGSLMCDTLRWFRGLYVLGVSPVASQL